MTDFKKVTLALAAAGLLSSGASQAALYDRGGGLIYDDVLDITWLADANYAQTSGYDSDGRMTFWVANNAWAAGLSYGGFDDWRLPTALNQDGSGPCANYYCTSSEMGHMFYNNWGAILGSTLVWTNPTNLALFTNLQSYTYWSGTVNAPTAPFGAWAFETTGGGQGNYNKALEFYAWAVRDGDVAAIPEPETYAMLLAGLGLLGGVAKWRRRSFGAS